MLNRIKHVSAPKVKREIDITFPAPANIKEAVNEYGDELVYSIFMRGVDIAAQAETRRLLEGTEDDRKSDAEAKKAMSEWKPTLRVATDPKEKLKKQLEKLDPETRKALLAELNQK